MMPFRYHLTNALLISVTFAWAYPFYCIARYGTHIVQEPNLGILVLEIAMFTGIIIFGVSNIVWGMKRRYDDKR